MSRKVCSNNYYTPMKWIEGMSSALAPHSCVYSTLDPISAVRYSCSRRTWRRKRSRREWI